MNKYLMLSAAAAMAASAGTAQATTVHFNSYCDYYVITKNGGGLYGATHVSPGCGSSQVYAAGIKGSDALLGKAVDFADPTWAVLGIGPIGLDFDIQRPFSPGHTWAIVASTNGSTAFVLNSGTTTAKVRPGSKVSTMSKAIAAFKISKK